MDASLLWRARGIIILGTLGTIGVFAGIGWMLDAWLGTAPKALIILIVLSFPVSNLISIRLIKSYLSPSDTPTP